MRQCRYVARYARKRPSVWALSDAYVVKLGRGQHDREPRPAHLSNDDWARVREFMELAKKRGEIVEFSTRVELLTPAEVAKRLGMSRLTVLRRIADGDIEATKVGTHHRYPAERVRAIQS